MIARTCRILLAAGAFALPALAHANKHYHVELCNQSDAPAQVYYKAAKGADQIGDVKPDILMHHVSGNKLEPGKCAKMSFVVKYEGLLSPATLVAIGFFADDGLVEAEFSGVKHETLVTTTKNPKGRKLGSDGKGEHLKIFLTK